MSAVGMDTSVVLRLLTGEPADQARAALNWLHETRLAGDMPFISDLVITETYFALQYHFGVPKHEAIKHLHSFISSGEVASAPGVAAILAMDNLAVSNPGLVDRLIHTGYVGGEATAMVTFEKAARHLPKVILLDA